MDNPIITCFHKLVLTVLIATLPLQAQGQEGQPNQFILLFDVGPGGQIMREDAYGRRVSERIQTIFEEKGLSNGDRLTIATFGISSLASHLAMTELNRNFVVNSKYATAEALIRGLPGLVRKAQAVSAQGSSDLFARLAQMGNETGCIGSTDVTFVIVTNGREIGNVSVEADGLRRFSLAAPASRTTRLCGSVHWVGFWSDGSESELRDAGIEVFTNASTALGAHDVNFYQ